MLFALALSSVHLATGIRHDVTVMRKSGAILFPMSCLALIAVFAYEGCHIKLSQRPAVLRWKRGWKFLIAVSMIAITSASIGLFWTDSDYLIVKVSAGISGVVFIVAMLALMHRPASDNGISA